MLYLRRYKELIIIGLLAAGFFVATCSFNFLTQTDGYIKWSSPDETANYFFAREFAQTGKLAFFDRAGVVGDYLLMPRSVRNDFGFIKPVSFLGIILIYGGLASVFGVAIIPYLTPLFAALGLVIFYLLIKRLFDQRTAFWSAVILAFFPVYIYYTVRSLFHNVLFIVLALAGLYFITLALGPKTEDQPAFLTWRLPARFWREFVAAGLAGLFLGLALITRTSEILWLAPALFLAWLFYARRLGISKLVMMLAGLVPPFLLVAYYNQILYNSFWYGGYNEMNRSLDDIALTGRALWDAGWGRDWLLYWRAYFDRLVANIFYFGLNPRQSLSMAGHYILDMFPLLSGAALLGWLLAVVKNIRRPRRRQLVVFFAWLLSSIFLIFYYGSWKFNDNPDLSRFTIGNSYTRYWLPIYLGLIPLAALALVRLTGALCKLVLPEQGRWRAIAAAGLQSLAVLGLAIWSLDFVLFGSEEGLSRLYHLSLAERANTEHVLAVTGPEAVIITRYHDKFFWPERRVIMGTLPSDEILTAAAKLVRDYPVYYYYFYLPEADLDYLNSRRLPAYGLRLVTVGRYNADFGLYRLEKYEPAAEETVQ